MTKVRTAPDFVIIFATLVLLGIGIVMVYSASMVVAQKFGDPYFFTKRQLIFALLGVGSMYAMMNIDYWVWKKWANVGYMASIASLILVLIVGVEVNGTKGWLGIGSFGIQPGEFAKFGVVAFMARWLSENQKQIVLFKKGLVPALAIPAVCFALLMLQPDFGMGVVLMGTAIVMIFAAGARISHFAWFGLIGIAGFVGLIVSAPYRMKRITAFLDPWSAPLEGGYQIIQSLLAIGPGGLLGLGLFEGRQKYAYLPEPYNDFIFSIVAEELGFVGGTLVLLLFLLLLWRGMRVAITAPDLFGNLLALGIIGMIGIQVVLNVGVVTGMFPVTGLTLPFLSYGGSSLTLMLTGVGVLLNISRFSR